MITIRAPSREPWQGNSFDYFDVIKSSMLSMNLSIQERAFVQWCNIYLKTKGCKIGHLAQLSDGRYLIFLLEALSGKVLSADKNCNNVNLQDPSQIQENWNIIRDHIKSEGIVVPQWPEKAHLVQQNQQLISELIWQCILHYHVAKDDETMNQGGTIGYETAAKSLLRWVQGKIPECKMRNLSTDFCDGKALCSLVNAIAPGTIPESMYCGESMPEMSVRVAMQAAEDELGIPELIPAYEMVNGNADDKSVLTYIALFRSAERLCAAGIRPISTGRLIENIQNPNLVNQMNNSEVYLEKRSLRCIAYGSGLRYGEVGKPAEFIVQLNGAQPSDLSICIECKPYDQRIPVYKPELRIKPVGETSYIVRYTPTRPGNFLISILCGGENIPNSPFSISIRETVNTFNGCKEDDLTLSRDSGFESSCLSEGYATPSMSCKPALGTSEALSSSFVQTARKNFLELLRNGSLLEPSAIDPQCEARGPGLYSGEVGVMGNFSVFTPNSDKGPLSVCVTCPAMSIPVPYVRTRLQDYTLVHDVMYLPTEAGIYEIDVKWGVTPIKGSPFRLVITDAKLDKNDQRRIALPELSRLPRYELEKSSNIVVYFSATSSNARCQEHKEKVVNCIKRNIEKMPSVRLLTVAIDLEVTNSERKKVLDIARDTALPLVFIDGHYVGGYDQIIDLEEKGQLAEYFMRRKEKSQTHTGTAITNNRSPPFRKRIAHQLSKKRILIGNK